MDGSGNLLDYEQISTKYRFNPPKSDISLKKGITPTICVPVKKYYVFLTC